MKFLKAMASALARAFAVAAYVVYFGASWVHRQTVAGSTDFANANEVVADDAEDEEERERQLYLEAQLRRAREIRAERTPDGQMRRFMSDYAQARMRGEGVEPHRLPEFARRHGCDVPLPDEGEEQRPTLH
jgi:hypothetical protein